MVTSESHTLSFAAKVPLLARIRGQTIARYPRCRRLVRAPGLGACAEVLQGGGRGRPRTWAHERLAWRREMAAMRF